MMNRTKNVVAQFIERRLKTPDKSGNYKFQGRKIDLVIEPKILIKSGIIE